MPTVGDRAIGEELAADVFLSLWRPWRWLALRVETKVVHRGKIPSGLSELLLKLFIGHPKIIRRPAAKNQSCDRICVGVRRNHRVGTPPAASTFRAHL